MRTAKQVNGVAYIHDDGRSFFLMPKGRPTAKGTEPPSGGSTLADMKLVSSPVNRLHTSFAHLPDRPQRPEVAEEDLMPWLAGTAIRGIAKKQGVRPLTRMPNSKYLTHNLALLYVFDSLAAWRYFHLASIPLLFCKGSLDSTPSRIYGPEAHQHFARAPRPALP
ncbi:hypothetical protein CY34DRAFT_11792 [Suillus luteus UH-Slu-Lm8-n1]|uniref:Uncharacterized protein n=1 Tax=Suillus luteus UH-Slu-Lm8-n1 TaxID=930992 RepID=A0A0D0ANA4_9AGAM|nr:hypothetical protein CY34DRAFT_11792 [Suillus luteus UH-Slu-Lm8-n1]